MIPEIPGIVKCVSLILFILFNFKIVFICWSKPKMEATTEVYAIFNRFINTEKKEFYGLELVYNYYLPGKCRAVLLQRLTTLN